MASPEGSFCFPLQILQSDQLLIQPFVFNKHAHLLVEGVKDTPELFSYVVQGPFPSVAEFQQFYTTKILSSDRDTLFAISVKQQRSSHAGQEGTSEQFAGMIGYQNADAANLCIEIGFIVVLPEFRGTFVAKTAVALMLAYALDSPPNGLGLRRCQWQAHADNVASIKLAEKLKFTYEGTLRFQRVMPIGKKGNGIDVSGMPNVTGLASGPSRDTVVYAHYCDQWREKKSALSESIGF